MKLWVVGVYLLYICLCQLGFLCVKTFYVRTTWLEELDGAFLELNNIIIYTFVTQQTTYCECQSNQFD